MARVVVAGASGDLGARIVRALLEEGAEVRALVHRKPPPDGAEAYRVELRNVENVARACEGASVVVSALAGLREQIVDAQRILLDGAVKAGVPRFFPSDFAADFTKTQPDRNRNFDLRREFMAYADRAPLSVTSILNGAFMELLTGEAPFLIPQIHRALAWGDADQKMDFTTKDDVATYTAKAALDASTPRVLRIAGSEVSARDLARIATDVTGKPWKVLRPGPIAIFSGVIAVAKLVQPAPHELYPAWQGMQYMRDMMEGDAKLSPLDNDRYPMTWTPVDDVIRGAFA